MSDDDDSIFNIEPDTNFIGEEQQQPHSNNVTLSNHGTSFRLHNSQFIPQLGHDATTMSEEDFYYLFRHVDLKEIQ